MMHNAFTQSSPNPSMHMQDPTLNSAMRIPWSRDSQYSPYLEGEPQAAVGRAAT